MSALRRRRFNYGAGQVAKSASNPAISVKEEFFTFNTRHPFDDRARLIDRNGHIVHGPRFGLSWRDGPFIAGGVTAW